MSSCDANPGDFVCPPCDQSCDALTFAEPGICPHCQMTLVKKSDLLAEQNMVIDEVHIETGSGMFKISGGPGHHGSVVNVYYHMPEHYSDSSQVLIVIPGAGRNGDSYRDSWVETSELYSILVLSPQYSEDDYPFEEYHLCGLIQNPNLRESISYVEHSNQVELDESTLEYELNLQTTSWIFNDFDRIFDMVTEELLNTNVSYDIFGHSAGGQILHRMAIFHNNQKVNQMIASNSGFYTLPDTSIAMPFGLSGFHLSEDDLVDAFKAPLVLLIGELDNENEKRGTFLRSTKADEQGMGRLNRANYFYNYSKNEAENLNTTFNWQLYTVPKVGHDQQLMAEAAAATLYDN